MVKPVFIFALPRSGSTMLQRVLSAHAEIASSAEPWLLLPLVYSRRNSGILTEYSHEGACNAIYDFIDSIQTGEEVYNRCAREFILSLYQKQCRKNEQYFLDKTPRYYYIIKDIAEIFPQAKFIFLFRNPVQVFASVISTWGQGCLRNIRGSYNDIYYGPKLLAEGFQLLQDKSYCLKYEDFVEFPEHHLKEMFNYLNLSYDKKIIENFNEISFDGRMGDSIGTREYLGVSSRSKDKWKDVFGTCVRKKFIKSYIHSLDDLIFNIEGYSKEDILKDVEGLRFKFGNPVSELIDIFLGKLLWKSKANIFFGRKIKNRIRGRFLS